MRTVVGLVAIGLVLAVASAVSLGLGAAVTIGLVLVVANVALMRAAGTVRPPGSDRLAPLLAGSWLTILLFGMHNIQHRSTEEVVQALSAQTAIELVLFGLVGAVSFFVLRTVVPLVPITPTLMLLPIILAASAVWGRGDTALYALARSAEVLVMVILATATAGVAAIDPRRFEETVWTFLRWTVWTVAGLTVAGAALGPLYVNRSPANADRFTWIGAHPASAGFILSIAFLIVISAPRASLAIGRRPRAAMVVAFGAALYLNQARTALLTVGLGVLLVARHTAKKRPEIAVLTTLVASIGAVLSAGFVGRYFLRGGDADTVLTLNGRTDLWQIAYTELDTVGKWLLGLGYGSGRVIFVDDYKFATSAHNSLLSILVDAGLVGAFLVVTGTLVVLWAALRAANASQRSYSLTLATLMLANLVTASTSDRLVRPGTAMVLLYFAAAVVAAERSMPEPHPARAESEPRRSPERPRTG